jgi:hypothetical protein
MGMVMSSVCLKYLKGKGMEFFFNFFYFWMEEIVRLLIFSTFRRLPEVFQRFGFWAEVPCMVRFFLSDKDN